MAEDVAWEQYRELDPIGAAQQQAQFWAIDRGLASAPDAEGAAGDAPLLEAPAA